MKKIFVLAVLLIASVANAQYFPSTIPIGRTAVKIFGKNVVDSVPINKGGTASKTRQAAIDTLTNVSRATTGWVLTDSSSHAVWQAAAGGGGSSKQAIQASWRRNFNAGSAMPLAGYSEGGTSGTGMPRSFTNSSVTVFLIPGTLKNWGVSANAAATTDTVYLYKSSDFGSTWTLTALKIILNGATHASDLTHTSTVAANDWYSVFYGSGGEDLSITDGGSCIEFDPN